jgi:superfamily II DNA/RNA helicase
LTLDEKRVVLSLPQTLSNTLKKYPDAIEKFEFVIINEVDQIIKRIGAKSFLKQPYTKLMDHFSSKLIVGMSGTLRDNHYVLNNDQMKIKKELITLSELLGSIKLISMDSIKNTDVSTHIIPSEVIATSIQDDRLSLVSQELDLFIEEAKNKLLQELKEEYPHLYYQAKKDFSVLLGPLPVREEISKPFHLGYLTRKYLWAMSGEKSRRHLLRYGLSKSFVYGSLPEIPGKFFAVRNLIKNHKKSVVLCSYLDTVDILNELITSSNIATIKITGKVNQLERTQQLDYFRKSDTQMVALLSNVGERDLDIPEADLLIIFDLIRTTKTVYQKLKRSRGGTCRILYYEGTKERQKAMSVIGDIGEKYPWSTTILPLEKIIEEC